MGTQQLFISMGQPSFIQDVKVCNYVHKNLLLGPWLSQLNPLHNLRTYVP